MFTRENVYKSLDRKYDNKFGTGVTRIVAAMTIKWNYIYFLKKNYKREIASNCKKYTFIG